MATVSASASIGVREGVSSRLAALAAWVLDARYARTRRRRTRRVDRLTARLLDECHRIGEPELELLFVAVTSLRLSGRHVEGLRAVLGLEVVAESLRCGGTRGGGPC